MKKSILALALICFSFNAFGKNIELKISTKWKNNGLEKVAESTVLVKLGHDWELPFNGKNSSKLKMRVTEDVEKGEIFFKAQIVEMIDGKEKIVSSPEVITVMGKEASITTTKDDGEYFEIKLLPQESKKI